MISRELELFAGAGDDTAVALVEETAHRGSEQDRRARRSGPTEEAARHLKKARVPLYPISAVTGEGLPALLDAMWREVARAPESTVA